MPRNELMPPVGCTNFKLRQLMRRVSSIYEAEMSALGLKITQYSLLTHIEKLAPVSQARLASEMAMDASTLSRNLRPLLAAGWVAVENGDDARSHTLSLTADGLAKRAAAKRAWKRAQLNLNSVVGEREIAKLHALIDQMTESLVERAA